MVGGNATRANSAKAEDAKPRGFHTLPLHVKHEMPAGLPNVTLSGAMHHALPIEPHPA